MQAVCAKCGRLMCRAVVLFLVAECAQTTPMIAPLPGDPNFSIDGSVAFFKSGESNPTQPNPPTPGRHRDPDRTRTLEGSAPKTRGGPGLSTAGRHPEGEQGGRGVTPPPHPPASPQAAWPPAPTPRGRGAGPPPRPREEPERDPPPRPSRWLPQGPQRTSEPAPTRQDAAQIAPREGGRARTGVVWGATPPMDSATPVTPALLPAQGRQRDGTRQSNPPPYRPPPAAQTGGTAHAPPPSPPPGTRTPRTRPAARSPHRACRPRGRRGAPTPARAHPEHVDSGPQQLAQWAGSRGRGGA